MYLEKETGDRMHAITEIRSVFSLTTGGYAIFRSEVSIPLERIVTTALRKTQHELTSRLSGTYLARKPQRIPKPMPPAMDRGPRKIWKTRASGKQNKG